MIIRRAAHRHAGIRLLALPLGVSSFALAVTVPALAAPVNWDGQSNTDWSDATNWSPDGVPTAADTVTIDGAGGANQPNIVSPDSFTVTQTNVSAGTLTIGGTLVSGVTVSGSGTVVIQSGGEITGNVSSGASLNNAGTITGILTVTGGTTNITGSVIGSTTTISGGALNVTGSGSINATSVAVNGGTLTTDSDALASTATVTVATGGTFTSSGTDSFTALTQNGGTVNGSGVQTLTGAFAQTGGTTSGTVAIVAGTFTQNGGTIGSGTTVTANTSATLSGGTIAGTLNGVGAITVDSGTTDLTGAGQIINAASISIQAGGKLTSDGNAIGDGIDVTANGTLQLTGNEVIGKLSGAASGAISVGSNIFTTASGANSTYAGSVSGNGNSVFSKDGAGVLTLSGDGSAFSGTLGASFGEMVLASGSTFNAGAVGAITGATMTIAGGGILTNADVGVISDGTINFNGSETAAYLTANSFAGPGTGTININGVGTVLTLAGGSLPSGHSGSIAGTGALNVSGGTHVLSGTNTFTGGLTVSGGTLAVSSGAAIADSSAVTVAAGATLDVNTEETIGSLAGQGNVSLDAGLTTGGNANTTFSGVISGSAGVTKQGSGIFTLSGTNTYSGTTTVNAGTLSLSGGSAIANLGAINVASGATLDVNNAETVGSVQGSGSINLDAALTTGGNNNSSTFSGVISGSGGLTKAGSGTFTLSSTNIYTGQTMVNAGMLALSGGSAIADTGAVAVSAGAILKVGTAETIGSLAGGGSISLDESLTTGNGSDTTFSGVIAGLGDLTKTGSGTFTLSGSNTYTGATIVNGGSLKVTGSISSDVTVNDGAKLMGTGSVGSVSVNSGGTLAPGASIESLDINGDLTLLAGSFTDVEVDPTSSLADLIAVTGTATLGGTLRHVGEDGAYKAFTTYTILTAASVNGTFDAVASEYLFLDPTVAYYTDHVDLTLVRNNVDLASAAKTPNQAGVANAIDGSIANLEQGTPAYQALVNDLVMVSDEANFRNSLDQLSGAEYAQTLQSVLWSTRAIDRVITERMECGVSERGYAQVDGNNYVVPTADTPMAATGCFKPGQLALWTRGFGAWNSLDGDVNAPGYDETQYGILFGADYSFDGSWFLGVTGGYFNANADFDSFGDRPGAGSDYDGLQLAAYGGFDDSIFYARGILAYGNYDGNSSRIVQVPGGIAGQLKGEPSSDTVSFYGETGYRFALGNTGHVTPFAGLALASANMDGFTESDRNGTGAALKVDDANASSVASVLGVRLDTAIATGAGAFQPELSLAWSHEFGDTSQNVSMSFADGPPGTGFTVSGSNVARNALLVDAGGKLQISDSLDLGLSYTGWLSSDYTSNSVTARLGVRF